MSKIVIILPYFGKLPNYFQLFLNSCSQNKKIDFKIFTDQNCEQYKYDNNISFYKMNLKDLSKLSMKQLKIKKPIQSPYKLCDYKPTYGLLFEDYIKEYTHWGYCDCDLIFGNLNYLINDNILEKYDKILEDGHLTIYKNNKNINEMFKKKYDDIINFEDAVNIKDPCFFDEIFFPMICEKNNVKTYKNKKIYADILPQNFNMYMPQDNIKKQKFIYNNGIIKRINDNKEYLYIHLQKRKMLIDNDFDHEKAIYILPNIFTNDKNFSVQYDKKYKIKYYIKYLKRINFNKIKIKLKTMKLKERGRI